MVKEAGKKKKLETDVRLKIAVACSFLSVLVFAIILCVNGHSDQSDHIPSTISMPKLLAVSRIYLSM